MEMIIKTIWVWSSDGKCKKIITAGATQQIALSRAMVKASRIKGVIGYSDQPLLYLICKECDNHEIYSPDEWYELCNVTKVCPHCGATN